MDKCHVCGSAMKKEKVKMKLGDQTIEVDGIRCTKCREVLLDPEQAQKLLALNTKKAYGESRLLTQEKVDWGRLKGIIKSDESSVELQHKAFGATKIRGRRTVGKRAGKEVVNRTHCASKVKDEIIDRIIESTENSL